MNTQTQNNNIRGMNFADTSQNNEDDDLVFDPVVERKRIADGTEEYLEELRHDFAKYTAGKNSFPERISKISSALREWMLSYDRTKFYDQLAQELHLQGADRMGIAQVAWDIVLKSEWSPSVDFFQRYIGDVSAIPELVKRFSVEFIPQAQKLASVPDVISREITSNASGYGVVEEKKHIHAEISLMKALGKFEKLGGQQVTNSKIVVKGQNDPVRPTIFNWLRAYRDELGVGAHDAVVRGQFLFHSLNGKGLSADERDQVGMLLKSLDENVPLTIDAGRQEVLFREQRTGNREQGTDNREHIQNTKYKIQNTEQNISRAVFELPHIMEQGTLPHSVGTESVAGRQEIPNTKYQIQNTNQGRPSAFEQAKAIQEANRDARLSISNMNAETVELGKMETSREDVRPIVPSRPPIAPQSVAPAPRAVSFEPAKIDNFSFGAGRGSDLQTNPSPAQTRALPLERGAGEREAIVPERLPASGGGRPLFANDANVSAVSFSTNHVLPAEKERIREQEIPNTERPLPRQTADAPARGGQANQTTAPAPAPVKQAPAPPPVNRFRITPTGHRDEVASDDTPSPHVVDLRG